jgi:hypothetical protein
MVLITFTLLSSLLILGRPANGILGRSQYPSTHTDNTNMHSPLDGMSRTTPIGSANDLPRSGKKQALGIML